MRRASAGVWPSRRRTASVALIVVMASFSLALWTGLPVAVLWLASRLRGSGFGLSGPGILVLVLGMPASMALGGVSLARLNRLYLALNGSAAPRRAPSWRRSTGDSGAPPAASALDTILVGSVLAAVLALAASIVFTSAPSPLP
jgi:hypothetical protein